MQKERIIIAILLAFAGILPLVFANGQHEEETGIRHQFEETLPFNHFYEGHVFAGIMLVLLWVSFLYLIYNLVQKLMKK